MTLLYEYSQKNSLKPSNFVLKGTKVCYNKIANLLYSKTLKTSKVRDKPNLDTNIDIILYKNRMQLPQNIGDLKATYVTVLIKIDV